MAPMKGISTASGITGSSRTPEYIFIFDFHPLQGIDAIIPLGNHERESLFPFLVPCPPASNTIFHSLLYFSLLHN